MDCSTPLSLTISQSLPKFMFDLWCCPAISSSDAFFSFCPQSFTASVTFPMSCLFASESQNTRASASESVLSVNIQGWSPLRLTGLISLLSKGLSGVFSSTTDKRHQFFGILPSLQSSSHKLYVTTGKTIALTMWTLVGRVMSLLFSTLSRFVIAFLPKSKCLLIHGCSQNLQWFWSPRRGNLSLLSPFPLLFAMR